MQTQSNFNPLIVRPRPRCAGRSGTNPTLPKIVENFEVLTHPGLRKIYPISPEYIVVATQGTHILVSDPPVDLVSTTPVAQGDFTESHISFERARVNMLHSTYLAYLSDKLPLTAAIKATLNYPLLFASTQRLNRLKSPLGAHALMHIMAQTTTMHERRRFLLNFGRYELRMSDVYDDSLYVLTLPRVEHGEGPIPGFNWDDLTERVCTFFTDFSEQEIFGYGPLHDRYAQLVAECIIALGGYATFPTRRFYYMVMDGTSVDASAAALMVPEAQGLMDGVNRATDALTESVNVIAPEVISAMSKLGAMSDGVNEALTTWPETTRQIADTMRGVDESTKVFSAMCGKATSILDAVNGVAQSLFTTAGSAFTPEKVWQVGELILDLIGDAMGNFDIAYPRWISYISRFVRLFAMNAYTAVSTFVARFCGFFLEKPPAESFELEAQGVSETLTMSTMLLALGGVALTGRVPTMKEVKNVSSYAQLFNVTFPVVKNLNSLFEFIGTYIPDIVKSWLYEICPDFLVSSAVKGAFGDYIRSVIAFVESHKVNDVVHNTLLQAELKTLVTDGQEHALFVASVKDHDGKYFSLVRDYLKKVDTMNESVETILAAGTARRTPFCVMFGGASQLGKSMIAGKLIDWMFADLEVGSRRYVRKVASKTFDGYHGQICLSYDDFAQDRSTYADCLELIDVITPAPFILPMAAMDNAAIGVKGTCLTAKMVTLCGNDLYPNAATVIADPRALQRRRHVLVQVVLRDGATVDGKIVYQHDFSHLRFVIRKNDDPQAPAIREFDTVLELFTYIAQCRLAHERQQGDCESIKASDWSLPEYSSIVLAQGDDVEVVRQCIAAGVSIPQHLRGPNHVIGTKHVLFSSKEMPSAPMLDKLYPQYAEKSRSEATRDCLLADSAYKIHLENMRKHHLSYRRRMKVRLDDIAGGVKDRVELALAEFDATIKRATTLRKGAKYMLLTAVAMGATLGAFWHLYKRAQSAVTSASQSREVNEVDDQGFPTGKVWKISGEGAAVSGDERTRRGQKGKSSVRYRAEGTRSDNRAEGTLDSNADQIATHSIGNNLGAMTTETLSGYSRKMGCLAIGGTFLLCTRHQFFNELGQLMPENSMITFSHEGKNYKTYFTLDRYYELKTESGSIKDLVVYEFGSALRSFKPIHHLFVSSDHLQYITHSPGVLLRRTNDWYDRTMVSIQPITELDYTVVNKTATTPMRILRGFRYNAATSNGDCGSPLVCFNTKVPGKILGIHVAGVTGANEGYSQLVTCQDLAFIGDLLAYRVKNYATPEISSQGDDTTLPRFDFPDGHYTSFGTVATAKIPFAPTKSSIRPSVIHEKLFPAETCPVSLNVRNLTNAVSKYGTPTDPWRPDILKICIDAVCDELFTYTPLLTGVLSEDIAINGIENVKFVDRMNMKSSPGYPYMLNAPKGGKHWLFTNTGDEQSPHYVLENGPLRHALSLRLARARNGERTDSIAVDCMKDERRVPGKDPRIFTILPVDHTIAMRQYFLSFAAYFYDSNLTCFSAVGMETFSQQWSIMVEKLLEVSPTGFAGDYTAFDGHLHPDLLDAALTVMERFYERYDENRTPEDTLVRRTLIDEVIHTVVLATNVMYGKHGGNPSGQFLTTVMNTIVNQLMMMYCWMILAPMEKKSLTYYREFVRGFMYGDDNILAVHPDYQDFFNAYSVSTLLGKIGIGYTNASKTAEIVPISPIIELTFLKCGIIKDRGLYKPLLAMRSIKECTNWITKNGDPFICTVDNCNEALRFMYFYGLQEFTSLRNKLHDALIPFARRFVLHSWDHYERFYYADTASRLFGAPTAQGDEVSDQGPSAASGSVTTAPAVHFIEQTTEATNVTVPTKNVHQSRSGTETPWNLDTVLMKPVRAGTYPFAIADTSNTLLKSFDFPDWYLKSTVFGNIFNSFTFWKGRPKIRIELNGTRFHQGLLCAWYVPMNSSGDVVDWRLNRSRQTTLQHAFLDASKNSVVEFDIPWFYYRDYVDLNLLRANIATPTKNIPLGTLNISVFNPLFVSTGGSSTIYYTVIISSHDNEFHIPVVSAVSQGNSTSFQYDMSNWKDVAGVTLPNNVTGDSFDLKADVSSMDKPNCTLIPTPFYRKPFPYLGHASNIEYLNRLVLEPGCVTATDASYTGTTEDEMSISHLTSKMTYLGTIDIVDTAVPGAVLMNIPIQPIHMSVPDIDEPALVPATDYVNTNLYMPLMSYVTSLFDYWRGGMKIKFHFISTAFHTAKFSFTLNYGNYNRDYIATAGVEESSQYVYIFELNADKREFEFEVPYISNVAWKRVPTEFPSVTPVAGTAQQIFAAQQSTGYMTLQLINALVHPDNVASQIEVNMFIGGMPDYELNFLSQTSRWIPQAQGQDSELQTQAFNLTTPTSNVLCEKYTSLRQLLKRYVPIRTDIEPTESVIPTAIPFVVNPTYLFGIVNDPSHGDTQNLTFHPLNCLSTLYRAHRGSVRYKFLTSSASVLAFSPSYSFDLSYTPIATSNNDIQSQTDLGTTAVGVTYLDFAAMAGNTQRRSYVSGTTTYSMYNTATFSARDVSNQLAPYNEIEIPYVSQNNIRLIANSRYSASYSPTRAKQNGTTDSGYSTWSDANNCGTIYGTVTPNPIDQSTGTALSITTYVAIGDDHRMFGLLGVPPLRYNAFVITDSVGPSTTYNDPFPSSTSLALL